MARHVVVRTLLVVAVLAGAIVALWIWGIPRYRPEVKFNQTYGIDTSEATGPVDWQLVASDDIGFVLHEATNGADGVDTSFATNWEASKAAGLRVGAVHIFSMCSPGGAQAQQFLSVAVPDLEDIPPAVVFDERTGCTSEISPGQALSEVEDFLAMVEERHERQVLMYIDGDFGYLTELETVRRAWRRSLFRSPDGGDWTVWQLHNRPLIAGIGGPVNLNIALIDLLDN